MARYRLTQSADRDFESILEFGINRFGMNQAVEYANGLKSRFSEIAANPNLYQAVDHIRAGYRRSVFKSHSIFYKVDDGLVLIIRILGRENLETAFPDVNWLSPKRKTRKCQQTD